MFNQTLYFLKNINSRLLLKLNIFSIENLEFFRSQVSKIINLNIKKPLVANKFLKTKFFQKNLFLKFFKYFYRTVFFLFVSETYHLLLILF